MKDTTRREGAEVLRALIEHEFRQLATLNPGFGALGTVFVYRRDAELKQGIEEMLDVDPQGVQPRLAVEPEQRVFVGRLPRYAASDLAKIENRLSQAPDDDQHTLLVYADLLAKNGRHRDALIPLRHAVELDSRDPYVRLRVGMTQSAAGDLPSARSELMTTLRIARSRGKERRPYGSTLVFMAQKELGLIEAALGNRDTALRRLRGAMRVAREPRSGLQDEIPALEEDIARIRTSPGVN
jgi:tetratricopeptide (TPR) repeat protein